MKSQIYDQAKYYEIAFSFVDQKNKKNCFILKSNNDVELFLAKLKKDLK